MGFRVEIRFSGTGGRGVVLAGIILAEAASRSKRHHVVQTVSYGPQVRGGMSRAEVVISDEEIDYPGALGLDLFVPFTSEACEEGVRLMKPGGVILVDPDLVPEAPAGWVAPLPLTRLAVQATGQAQMANIVALGAVTVLTSLVELPQMKAAVRDRAPEGLAEAFGRALQAGRKSARDIQGRITLEEEPSAED